MNSPNHRVIEEVLKLELESFITSHGWNLENSAQGLEGEQIGEQTQCYGLY